MLIVNDEQRLLAGVLSLDERCKYCSKAFRSIPSFRVMMLTRSCTMQRARSNSLLKSWSISTPFSARLLNMSHRIKRFTPLG